MLLTERYADKIKGEISCYDRLIITGTLPGWCFDQGMTAFLNANGIRIFDYPEFALKLREQIRENAEFIAKENNLEIEFIRKIKDFRKEKQLDQIIAQRGTHPGLVHIFSAMEVCTSYKPWYDKATGKTFLKYDTAKCLHYYFYFIDRDFGLCFMRVPTWAPFKLEFYLNGHNWLVTRLTKKEIAYQMRDNAFLAIGDYHKAQELSDSIRAEDLHQALDIFTPRYCPIIKQYGLLYRWSITRVEYATDIIFKNQADLKMIYEPLVRTAIHSVKPGNITSFLGQKLHGKYQGEIGTNFNTRIWGTRIKHQMGDHAIKMYDKFGLVLRIETTTNDVSQFKLYREVQQRDGNAVHQIARMKKNIYSLFPLMKLLKAANRRYLEFISTFDDPSQGIKDLNQVTRTVKLDERSYQGFNFFSEDDEELFTLLSRGEFNINGFQNQSLAQLLPNKSGSTITRIFKRLRSHGIIKKVKGTYKYYLTKLGQSTITTGLVIKNMVVIPSLANLSQRS